MATLPGAWHYRVSTGTGWPGVSILWLGELESLICNFCLSVAARKIVQIRPWDTFTCCWDIKQPTDKLCSDAYFKGFQPEWYISTMIYRGFLTRMVYLYNDISRVPDQNGISLQWYIGISLQWYIEGFRPELCISSMTYSRDTPFWPKTLNIVEIHQSGRKPSICTTI